eukprot:COSAG04_NODE_15243_length_538_cov_1.608200_1_plen_84_part_10
MVASTVVAQPAAPSAVGADDSLAARVASMKQKHKGSGKVRAARAKLAAAEEKQCAARTKVQRVKAQRAIAAAQKALDRAEDAAA